MSNRLLGIFALLYILVALAIPAERYTPLDDTHYIDQFTQRIHTGEMPK